MKTVDLLYITIQNFKTRKSRFFFTILGVAIAIAVVLSLVSFGYGLQKSLLERITTAESVLTLDILPSDSEVISIDDTVVTKISHLPNIDKVSPQASFTGQASYNSINSEITAHLTNPDFFGLDGKLPLAGAFFKKGEGKKVVVSALLAQLFNMSNEDIIGKKMKFTFSVPNPKNPEEPQEISVDDFSVVGVLDGAGNTGVVYFNRNDFPTLDIEHYDLAKVKVKDSKAMDEARIALVGMGFTVSSVSDVVSQANKIFSAIQIALGVFGTFALIVAAIGLINTMTISLLERINEIGIMRAIGAAPQDIRKIFLVESTLIGFFGGLSGIILGIIGSEVLNFGFNILARSFGGVYTRLFAYPIWFIFFIILLSTCVGFFGGFWPARRAARMNPLQALRYK
jgi:putative ABC transport system permease protein